ncbi:MAG: antirestriction protein ArdA [Desulfovibrionaceae bacterium]|nr:antirestriction protein ArdA [Desulfovibrionaceae bacterium]
MPSIYVASLSDYNNGCLHGVWIDFYKCNDISEVWQAIHSMLAASPTAKKYGDTAEEWAIHDYEEWPFKLREYENISTLWEVYALLQGEIDAGEWDAFAEFLENQGTDISEIDTDTVVDFREAYQGNYDSKEDFAEELANAAGLLECMPDNLKAYFDYEAYARDLFISDYWMSDSGNVFLYI